MKLIKIDYNKDLNKINRITKNGWNKIKIIINNYIISILLSVNIIINIYLLLENKNISKKIKDITDYKNTFDYKFNTFKNNFPYNDIELIGLKYPEINFDKIKSRLKNFNIIASLIDLINQIEVKLIYLEREINITKLVSFYTSRKIYLKEMNIKYDENNITELHEIINWIIIHKSDQLKGIASDKYLACKYVESKLGKNLCKQRVLVYNNIDEINYNEISKYGDIILKISNSCRKSMGISNNTSKENFEKNLKQFKKLLEFEHGLIDAQYFHLYAKKRIIIERKFLPTSDLYEFRFFIINNEIKFIILNYLINGYYIFSYYDANFNFIFNKNHENIKPLNISSTFNKNILEELKNYSIKLSEDFPNFIRVDLYVFHNTIYFSELTFASFFGWPINREEKLIRDSVKNFSRFG